MEELERTLKEVLANTFVMYFKAHASHWNVTGPDFSQYHDFFGKLYEELFDATDTIAEHIRALDFMAPNSLTSIKLMSTLSESDVPATSMSMFDDLLTANNLVLVSLMRAYKVAEDATELGLANFLQDRIDIHQKHGWMLKATLK